MKMHPTARDAQAAAPGLKGAFVSPIGEQAGGITVKDIVSRPVHFYENPMSEVAAVGRCWQTVRTGRARRRTEHSPTAERQWALYPDAGRRLQGRERSGLLLASSYRMSECLSERRASRIVSLQHCATRTSCCPYRSNIAGQPGTDDDNTRC